MTIQTVACYIPINGTLPAAFNYPETLTLSNFTMLLSGYFYAPKSGEYQFKINRADDLAYANIGAGSAFDCCQKSDTVSNPAASDLITELGASSNATVNLQAGVFYPLRLLYIDRYGNLGLEFQFVDADGILHETFDDYVYNFPDDSLGNICPMSVTTTTVPWTQTVTSTYTTETAYEVSDGSSTTAILVVVETPEVQTDTTTYTPWTGTTSNTIGTETVTETGSDGIPTVKTIYTVETPEGQTATTVYTSWTGEYTTTFATEIVTSTGEDGIPTIKAIYSVETPAETKPTFSGWASNTITSDVTSTQPTFSLTTVTTTSNGVTTVYTTTCPIDTTTTESASNEYHTSKSEIDETSTRETSFATGTNKDQSSSVEVTTASQNAEVSSAEIAITSDVSSESETRQAQTSSTAETRVVTTTTASTSNLISTYEGSAVKLLATPFIAVILALL